MKAPSCARANSIVRYRLRLFLMHTCAVPETARTGTGGSAVHAARIQNHERCAESAKQGQTTRRPWMTRRMTTTSAITRRR